MGRNRFPAAWVLAIAGLLASGCGAGQAVESVINTKNATDVVVQENLQVASELAQTLLQTATSYTGFGSSDSSTSTLKLTSGSSTGPSVVSYLVPGWSNGQALVLAAYNTASENCYGIIDIGSPIMRPILGEQDAGTYDFTYPHVVSAGCNAGIVSEYPTPPPGWPVGDPAGSGWPKP